MSEKKGFFSKYRIVFRRSSPLLKCMVLVVIVLSIVARLTIRSAILDQQAQREALRAQAAALEAENDRLEQDIAQLGTLESIINIAIQQLGLVDPNTEFYTPSN